MIESLRLERFKNFRDATLPLGPLTVIVGTNASGKSNLRDAFRFLHGMAMGYTLADIVGGRYVEGKLQWGGVRGGSREIAFHGQPSFTLESTLPIALKAGIKPKGYVHRVTVKVGESSRPLRIVRESLYRRGTMIFDSHPPVDPPTQVGPQTLLVRLGKNSKGTKVLPFDTDQPVLSRFASMGSFVPLRLRIKAQNVIEAIRSMRFLDLSPDLMKLPSIPGQSLSESGENLSSALQAICEDKRKKQAIVEWIKQLTPQDVAELEFVPDQTGRILLILVDESGRRTTAYSASDGTLRFLGIVAALMGPDASKFYFLEEIDNGIHPTRLGLLLQLIEQHTSQGKVQVVTTTHSPQLLGMLGAGSRQDAVLVYRPENSDEARIQRIVDIPAAKEVLERQNLSRLHESGWLENVAGFMEPEEAHG